MWDAITVRKCPYNFDFEEYENELRQNGEYYSNILNSIKTSAEASPEASSETSPEALDGSSETLDRVLKFVNMCTLYGLLSADNCTAMDLIESIYELLLGLPTFAYEGAYAMSSGMLTYQNQTQFVHGTSVIYDILIPNVYCVLLLEAKGQCAKESKSLNNLRSSENEYEFKSYEELSRSMSKNFPDSLKNLFAITRDEKNSAYQIATNYPRLFLAIMSKLDVSPLSKTDTVKNSLKYHWNFYTSCVQTISRHGDWSKDSFEEYYLFERLFRLHTKFTLAAAEHEAKDKKRILSPALLGELFYSSPLVFFPKNILQNLFYDNIENPLQEINENINADIDTGANHFLLFLIQLSSYWFPSVVTILRYYLQKHNRTNYEDVCHFLFPKPGDFSKFQANFRPSTIDLEPILLNRPFTVGYSNEWKKFIPSNGYCAEALTVPSLSDWAGKKYGKQYSVQDYCALDQIKTSILHNL